MIGLMLCLLIIGLGYNVYSNRVEDLLYGDAASLDYVLDNQDDLGSFGKSSYQALISDIPLFSMEQIDRVKIYFILYNSYPTIDWNGDKVDYDDAIFMELSKLYQQGEMPFDIVDSLYDERMPVDFLIDNKGFFDLELSHKVEVLKEEFVTGDYDEGFYLALDKMKILYNLSEYVDGETFKSSLLELDESFWKESYTSFFNNNLGSVTLANNIAVYTKSVFDLDNNFGMFEIVDTLKGAFLDYDSAKDALSAYAQLVSMQSMLGDDYRNLRNQLDKLVIEVTKLGSREYSIDNLVFENHSDYYAYLIDADAVVINDDEPAPFGKAIDDLYGRINRESMVKSMELEANKTYYLIWTNDYLCFDYMELINTFDGDYTQYVHGLESKELLEEKMQIVNDEYDIIDREYTYLEEMDESLYNDYEDMAVSVLEVYGKLLEPLIIGEDINQFFYRRGSKYYVNVNEILEPRIKRTDINFYIVDEFDESDSIAEATWGGVVLSDDIVYEYRMDVLHHELMHLIDEFYYENFHWDLVLHMDNKEYLIDQCETLEEFYEKLNEGYEEGLYYSDKVMDYLEYGVTSSYSMTEESEHQAELWASLITYNDEYAKVYGEYEAFDRAVDGMMFYMNRILRDLGEPTLDSIEDFRRYETFYDIFM